MIGNIIINKNDAFGNVNYEIVRALLYMVDRNMMDALGLDEDEIVNSKMDKNEAKYPVEKARGNSLKYDEL